MLVLLVIRKLPNENKKYKEESKKCFDTICQNINKVDFCFSYMFYNPLSYFKSTFYVKTYASTLSHFFFTVFSNSVFYFICEIIFFRPFYLPPRKQCSVYDII